MRQVFGVLLLLAFLATLTGCDSGKGGATIPTGTMEVPKEGPKPAGGGGGAGSSQ